MLKLCSVTKAKLLFLVLIYVFNFNLFEFSAAILEKGLFLEQLFLAMITVDHTIGLTNRRQFSMV